MNSKTCGSCGRDYSEMTFGDMFRKIELYHDCLGQLKTYDTKAQQMQSIRNLSLAAIIEMVELVDSLPWKPWRKINEQSEDIDNAKREIIDVIFFLVAICEDLHISGKELEEKFHEVLTNNTKRLVNGYSKVGFGKGGDK